MLNASVTNAMILLKGKPEAGSLTNPETGFYISEQNLDDSITDQISHVYTYLNNIILVINQHGTMMNNMMHGMKQFMDGREILTALKKINEDSEETEADRALKIIKQKFADMSHAIEVNTSKVTNLDTSIIKVEHKITDIEMSKATIGVVESRVADSENRVNKKSSDLDKKLSDRMGEVLTRSDSTITSMVEKVSKIEKELAWKINDYGDLLKLRPTDAVLESNMRNLEQKLKLEFDDIISKRLSETRSYNVHTLDETPLNKSTTSFNEIFEKMHHFENQ